MELNGARRPPTLVVVAGTGTAVGKTWVSCQLATRLRARGVSVAARKPAQSFDPAETGPTDAELLAGATGEEPSAVCPPERSYPVAMAPPMAAERCGRVMLSLAQLVSDLAWPARAEVGLVEQAGGLGSPQAVDGDGADMVSLLAPEVVVLVAGPGLGTLNPVRLAARALREPPLVFLNRFDPVDELHTANRAWLEERWRLPVAVDVDGLAVAVAALTRR